MKEFKPIDSSLFFSKNDPEDQRLGDIAKSVQLEDLPKSGKNSFVIAGYPDDEGIKINGGRLGASHAPDTIRKYLYKMTPSYLCPNSPEQVLDGGNLSASAELKDRHALARRAASIAMRQGYKWVALGGGHDYGFSDTAAFCESVASEKQKPLVINFDAHLDVRPTSKGLSSGTPFFRLLTEFPEIDFAEIGIQGQCNSANHVSWLKSKGGKILSMEEIRSSGERFEISVLKFLEPMIAKRTAAFLSIDIDAFTSSEAPGCSQSWTTGFRADEFLNVYQVLLKRLDVRGVAIYEVSPPLDQDDRTSKLAGLIVHRFLYPL